MSAPNNSNSPCFRTGVLALALGLAVAGTPGSASAEETPAPSDEAVLLTEIRDMMAAQSRGRPGL